jgi:hypothetical protein
MKTAVPFALWPALAAAIRFGAFASAPVYLQSTDESAFEISSTYGRNQDPISFVEPFATGLRTVGRYALVFSEFYVQRLS